MDIPFVEENCTLTFQGAEYTQSGAYITDSHLIAYLGENNVLTDWHSRAIGTWKYLSSRPAVFFGHRSFIGDRYYYIRAVLEDGRRYSLRGFGIGCLARGRRIK